jgi:argininosuccinate lyase
MNKSKPKKNKQTSSIWGGRFKKDSSEIMKTINASIWFDKRLAFHDISLSKEHSNMLSKQDIISSKENRMIQKGLNKIEKEITQNKFQFSEELEDIHMHIEARLIELIGDSGKKLHTARSRNDQVATSFKMWARDELDVVSLLIKNLQAALIFQADHHVNSVLPGFTHLQPAQPISLAHHLLAYVEMLGRDKSRIDDTKKRLNKCPLGAAALAGTSFPIDRLYTAKALGFTHPMENSIDAVSDRDFVLEVLSNASIIMVHLSRLAEEIVIWSSPGFNFISLPDSFSTGSSIMPQKRNPDAAELIRGKTGRVSSAFFNVLTMLKGLPLAYSKDMQEDKEPLFDAIDNLKICLEVSEGLIKEIIFNEDSMKNMAELGYITATDIADWLVKKCNIPFRDAHSITGKIVKYAENNNLTLGMITIDQFKKIDERITNDILKVLTLKNSLESRNSYGATAPKLVKKAINKAKAKWLK